MADCRLFGQWGNNHGVQKGERGMQWPNSPASVQPEEGGWRIPGRLQRLLQRGRWRAAWGQGASRGARAAWGKQRWTWSLFPGTAGAGWLILRLLAEVTACVLRFRCLSEKDALVFSFNETRQGRTLLHTCHQLCIWEKPWYKVLVPPSSSAWEAELCWNEAISRYSCSSLFRLQNNKHQLHGRADTTAVTSEKTLLDWECFNHNTGCYLINFKEVFKYWFLKHHFSPYGSHRKGKESSFTQAHLYNSRTSHTVYIFLIPDI